MLGPVQGVDELIVDAPAARIFDILEDTERLPEWTTVISAIGTREVVGAARQCQVDFEGKRGSVVERCVESIPASRIAWEMEKDSFGFSRILSDVGFSFTLEPFGESTLVRNETYYRPRGVIGAAMNALVIRRKFGAVRRRFLSNLKRLSEQANQVRS